MWARLRNRFGSGSRFLQGSAMSNPRDGLWALATDCQERTSCLSKPTKNTGPLVTIESAWASTILHSTLHHGLRSMNSLPGAVLQVFACYTKSNIRMPEALGTMRCTAKTRTESKSSLLRQMPNTSTWSPSQRRPATCRHFVPGLPYTAAAVASAETTNVTRRHTPPQAVTAVPLTPLTRTRRHHDHLPPDVRP